MSVSQEVPHGQGLQMLKAFHGHKHVTSIVDDFAFYENRAMQYQRSKQQNNNGFGTSKRFLIACSFLVQPPPPPSPVLRPIARF